MKIKIVNKNNEKDFRIIEEELFIKNNWNLNFDIATKEELEEDESSLLEGLSEEFIQDFELIKEELSKELDKEYRGAEQITIKEPIKEEVKKTITKKKVKKVNKSK